MSDLITLDAYKRLTPQQQGYVIYMQAEHPGSELKMYQENPYPTGSSEHMQWYDGQRMAVQVAQDSEE